MKKRFSTRKWFKNLTPKIAWDQYVDMSERIFISNFYLDGVYEIKEMCRIYAGEVPDLVSGRVLFTIDDIKLIGDLLEEHLEGYLEKIGGMKNMELYTEEELEEMFQEDTEIILKYLAEMERQKKRKPRLKVVPKN